MSIDAAAEMAREAVRSLSRESLGPEEFLSEVFEWVGRVVPFDAAGWMPLDPDSLLPSGMLETSKPSELVRALWRIDRTASSTDNLRRIARNRSPVTLMSDLAPEAADVSARVALIKRVGLREDLLVMFRSRGYTWGMGDLYREPGTRPFGEYERRFLSDLAPAIGEGLRLSLARRPTDALDGELGGPGVVVFNHVGRITAVTEEARKAMSLMRGDAASTVYAVAAHAAALDSATARMRLPDGRWLLLRGSRLHDRAGHQPHHMSGLRTVVTIMPATGSELVPVLLRLHGLTAREREVAELLFGDQPTGVIAAQLKISRYTLRDHTRAVCAKVGATGRAGLMTIATDYVNPGAG